MYYTVVTLENNFFCKQLFAYTESFDTAASKLAIISDIECCFVLLNLSFLQRLRFFYCYFCLFGNFGNASSHSFPIKHNLARRTSPLLAIK